MKPGLHDYFFAHAVWIAAHGGGLVFLILVVNVCRTNFEPPYDVWLILHTLLAFVASYLLGMLFGVMFLGRFVGLLAIKLNGGPFAVGDRVLILAGSHKGEVGTVYELWKSRFQLRVFLSEEEKKKVKDVLGDHQVWRVGKENDGSQC